MSRHHKVFTRVRSGLESVRVRRDFCRAKWFWGLRLIGQDGMLVGLFVNRLTRVPVAATGRRSAKTVNNKSF